MKKISTDVKILFIGIFLFSFMLGFFASNSATPVLGQLLSVLFPALASLIIVLMKSKTGFKDGELMKFTGYFLIVFSIAFSLGSWGGSHLRDKRTVFLSKSSAASGSGTSVVTE